MPQTVPHKAIIITSVPRIRPKDRVEPFSLVASKNTLYPSDKAINEPAITIGGLLCCVRGIITFRANNFRRKTGCQKNCRGGRDLFDRGTPPRSLTPRASQEMRSMLLSKHRCIRERLRRSIPPGDQLN